MTMSPFLSDLRARVGNDLLLLPSASVLVDDPDGGDRTLLVRHAETRLWGIIGGMVEPEEHPAAAAVREAEEETGLQVELISLLAVTGGPGYTIRYANGDLTSYVTSVYRARIVGGRPEADGVEVDQLRWFERWELPEVPLATFAANLLTELGVL